MSARRREPRPEPVREARVLPIELRVGDLVLDGDEAWEVVGHVESFRSGKGARARVQLPGRPETSRQIEWAAHERVRVRREARG